MAVAETANAHNYKDKVVFFVGVAETLTELGRRLAIPASLSFQDGKAGEHLLFIPLALPGQPHNLLVVLAPIGELLH
jgi:hypothetical protein